jgi:hypothetical protein
MTFGKSEWLKVQTSNNCIFFTINAYFFLTQDEKLILSLEMNAISSMTRLAALLAISLALAGTQSFGQSMISPPQSPLAFTVSGFSGSENLTFNGFNNALGTLTSVTIDLTNVQVGGYATLTANTTGQSITLASLEGEYEVTDGTNNVQITVLSPSAASSFPPTAVSNGDTYFVGGTAGSGQVGNGYIGTSTTPPGNFVQALSSPQNATPTVITTGLSFYEGGSNSVTLTLDSLNELDSNTSGGFNTSVFGTGTGDLSVVYTYTPVPEPAQTAAWMIGFGLCVLGGRKYFQRRTDLCRV